MLLNICNLEIVNVYAIQHVQSLCCVIIMRVIFRYSSVLLMGLQSMYIFCCKEDIFDIVSRFDWCMYKGNSCLLRHSFELNLLVNL